MEKKNNKMTEKKLAKTEVNKVTGNLVSDIHKMIDEARGAVAVTVNSYRGTEST